MKDFPPEPRPDVTVPTEASKAKVVEKFTKPVDPKSKGRWK